MARRRAPAYSSVPLRAVVAGELATHSPVVAALPGARILETGPWGLRETAWEDLDLVRHWRAFLDAPQRYLRHL